MRIMGTCMTCRPLTLCQSSFLHSKVLISEPFFEAYFICGTHCLMTYFLARIPLFLLGQFLSMSHSLLLHVLTHGAFFILVRAISEVSFPSSQFIFARKYTYLGRLSYWVWTASMGWVSGRMFAGLKDGSNFLG